MWALVRVALLIYVFFLVHFTLHEWVLPQGRNMNSFHFPGALLLWVDVFNAVMAYHVVKYRKLPRPRSPFPYLLVALPQQIGLVASNYAARYVDYPTLSLFKSAKPLVVMLCSVFLFRVHITFKKCLVVVVITLGLVVFAFNGHVSKSSISGLLLVLVSLFSDAIYVPMVDKLKVNEGGPYVVMLYSYAWSSAFVYIFRFREVFESIVFLVEHPNFVWRLVLFALTGSLAHMALFTAIDMCDGIVIAIITTTRKFFSILLSCILFQHRLSLTQWLGVIIVFTGLGMEIWFKREPEKHG